MGIGAYFLQLCRSDGNIIMGKQKILRALVFALLVRWGEALDGILHDCLRAEN